MFPPKQTLLEECELGSHMDLGSNSGLPLPTSGDIGQVSHLTSLASVSSSVKWVLIVPAA